jgi:lysozyme
MNRLILWAVLGLGVYLVLRPRSAGAFALQPNYSTGGFMSKRTSPAGVALLKQAEGLRLEPYKDQGGKLTIGYGHLIRPGESFGKISQLQAEQLLISDLAVAEHAVNSLVRVSITQNQFDALVSFVFNVGSGNFGSSTLLKELNAGNYNDAANQLTQWNKVTVGGVKVSSAGLSARRAAEKNLFLA